MRDLSVIQNKQGFICDMDGVVYHGNILLPGVSDFLNWLKSEKKDFLFLTNASGRTPQDLKDKLARMGLEEKKKHFYIA